MVSKSIRNGRKQKATRSPVSWPSLHALPQPSESDKKPLRSLRGGKKRSEPFSEALALTIPCRIDKPKSISPLFLVETSIVNGVERAESAVWQCQGCAFIFHSRQSWMRHVGLKGQDNKISDICAGA